MSLPIRTTLEDIRDICTYLANKPTGATAKDAAAVLDPKRLDPHCTSPKRVWPRSLIAVGRRPTIKVLDMDVEA